MLAAISAFGFQLSAFSEVPNLINYQGRLRDNATGLPLNGMVNIQVNLFTNETGGVPALPAQNIGLVPVTNGIYSLNFGSSTLPSLLSNPEVWLQVTVDGNILAPRQRLIAVPYAVVARSLDGYHCRVEDSDDVSGIVVGGPGGGRHLVVNDIKRARWALSTGGYKLSFQNDWQTNWNTRMVISEVGRVGIGTTSPAARLHVLDDDPVAYDAVYMTKTYSQTHSKRYTFANCGGQLSDAEGGAAWRGFLLGAPPLSVSNSTIYPTLFFYGEYDSLTNPVVRIWRIVSGGGLDHDIRIGSDVSADTLVVKPSGNVGIGTTAPSARLQVAGEAKATVFTPTSDRNVKENFTPVDGRTVLDKVSSLPISRWNFKELPGAQHIGPMAQDFYSAFGVGPDDKHIATVDADGVALAAIQGLNEKVESEKQTADARIESLEQRLEQKETEITELKTRLKMLEELFSAMKGAG